MTDTTQELDEIVSDLILDLTSEVGWQEVQAGVKAGLAIRNWHNEQIKAIEANIKALKLDEDEYDDTDPYQEGYMWAIHKAVGLVVEAERKQIKGE